ncbi:hypothetical protein HS088_TW08G00030 [Tripterygium wilfordii]|uniref:Longin domain-containing protein n=1 Tax=Tripterygium wilfordii TaxID=458696 RepID=A0A7J7DB15_TRIWF|nr:phytolongin Phyl2.2-like [Tripterygium wilfordii]KAF5743448.1 hypothetical protein HS088_TW08G00030 [Tripterygium wilfordii]
MISNPSQIFYACIANGTTILADFTSAEPGIQDLALQCIEKTPPFHTMFSHTVHKRSYNFLIDDPFVYFAVYHKDLDKIDVYEFLTGLKSAFEEVNRGGSNKGFSSHCFQSQFNPIFREILGLDLEFLNQTTNSDSREGRNWSLDLTKGQGVVKAPLLGGSPRNILKKKKRLFGDVKDVVAMENNKVDVGIDGNGNVVFRDFSPPPAHRSGIHMAGDRQKAKQVWRKHVWVVLILDLVVCAVLFGIWLGVCGGFKCIDG